MERGVVVGGLMICGSFLLAALLNRSAVEEVPPPAPAAVVAPMSPPAAEVEVAPATADCAEADSSAEAHSSTETKQPAPDRCGDAD